MNAQNRPAKQHTFEGLREELLDAIKAVAIYEACSNRENTALCAEAMADCTRKFAAFGRFITAGVEETVWGSKSSCDDFESTVESAADFIAGGDDIREHEDDSDFDGAPFNEPLTARDYGVGRYNRSGW